MTGNEGAVSYQWYSGSTAESVINPIAGETNSTLKVATTLVDQFLKVVVTDDDDIAESDVTAAVTTGELALKSVEGADNGTLTTLVAYFNKSVGDLQPGDIEIRNIADDELVTVEKVVLNSDKTKATLTLVGAAAGTGARLIANTDYKMIVDSSEGTAEKVFSIPAVDAAGVVTAVDATKKTITTQGGTNAGTFTDNDGFIEDYNEILGRTVTTTYDKDNNITKFVVKSSETVIYTAISGKDTNNSGNIDTIETTEKEKYQLVGGGDTGMATPTTSVYATREIRLDERAAADFAGTATTAVAGKPAAQYAKIVLNDNGTVRSIVDVEDWELSVYVASIKDSKYLVDASGAYTNLTDFNILKDGATITIDDIEAGDVVFVNTNANFKVAEVYSDNEVSGEITVYTGKADIGSTRYDLQGWAVIGNKVVAATTANVKDYDGADVVAYLNRQNKLAQVIVSSEAAATSSEFVVVTDNAKMYTEGTSTMVSFKGGNGDDIYEYVLDVDDLKSLTTLAGAKKTYAKGTVEPQSAPGAAFAGTFGLGANNDINVNQLIAGNLVKVIRNADGDIIGIELSNGKAADYDFGTTADKDMGATQTTNDFFEGKRTAMNVKTNIAALDGELIESTTPVYVYNKTNKTVKLVEYGDVDFTATAAAIDQIQVRFSGAKVAAFYIDETKSTMAASAIDTTVRGVLVSKTLDKNGTNYAEIEMYVGGEKVKYKTFAQDCANDATLVKDDFLDVALTADGSVYSVTKKASAAAKLGGFVVEDYTIDDKYILTTESGVTTTIVVKDAAGNYSTKTWSELGTLVDTMKTVKVATYGASTSYVDAVWVELDNGATMTTVNAEYADIAGLGLEVDNAASATTATVTVDAGTTGTAVNGTATYTKVSGTGTAGSAAVAGRVVTVTSDSSANETGTVEVVINGTYYTRTVVYAVAITDGATNEVVLSKLTDTITLA